MAEKDFESEKKKWTFVRRSTNTVHYGTDCLAFVGPQIWDKIPNNYKNFESLNIFQDEDKNFLTVPADYARLRFVLYS